MVLRFSLNLNFLWGWKCLSVHRGDSPLDKDPPPSGQIPPEQRTPHLEGTWAQTRSEIIHPSWKEHGIRQEVTSYTSLVWYLVVATAAVGTHPTGMHSRFICKHFPKRLKSVSQFRTNQFHVWNIYRSLWAKIQRRRFLCKLYAKSCFANCRN